VVLLVNSPGGAVAAYGLAAAQVRRLTANRSQDNIVTTVCVDQYAASGGYMIASQADHVVAAPFATLGSIGVIMEGLNFNELAKRYGVNPLIVKAGASKNPLSTWGPVSQRDLDEERGRMEKVHEAFQQLVVRARPVLQSKLKTVADGSVFLGTQAHELGLVDAVMTTDEYLLERIQAGDRVLRLHRTHQHWYRRQVNLSPMDILPHIRSWAASAEAKLASDDELKKLLSRFVRAGSWVGFAHHVLNKYFVVGPK